MVQTGERGETVGDETVTLKAIGLTCGIGSMLIGARSAGFRVAGNIEWRRYYHLRDEKGRNTFVENFDAPLYGPIEKMTAEEKAPFRNADLAMAHTECGHYSMLSTASGRNLHDESDIPRLIAMIAELKPRFFVSDNLPGSLVGVPLEAWKKQLPEYDIFPEMVSNYHYGNVQLHRRRLFLIGSLASEKFVFRPNERDSHLSVREVIGDLIGREGKIQAHDPHVSGSELCKAVYRLTSKTAGQATWREIREYFGRHPEGHILQYWTKEGRLAPKIGMRKGFWEKHCDVLTGTNPTCHPKTGLPYSIRERARIQGFPDDFVLRGVKLDKRGRWSHFENLPLVKQTGKAMPAQWCRDIAAQIRAHIERKKFEVTLVRHVRHPQVDAAKIEYCRTVGYTHQNAACHACWLVQECPVTPLPKEKQSEATRVVAPRTKNPRQGQANRRAIGPAENPPFEEAYIRRS